MANTILFAYHIYRLINSNKNLASDSPLRKLVFVTYLFKLGSFAWVATVPGCVLQVEWRARIHSIFVWNLRDRYFPTYLAHLHRHIRKALSGKSRRLGPAMFQLFFTFVFSLYTSYFLKLYQSIVPCILLHMYCNLLGPPIIAGSREILT